tara:strand:+ start:2911 stop:3783 length:873 start_codon:yes stop_codon:yes gene_type:complete
MIVRRDEEYRAVAAAGKAGARAAKVAKAAAAASKRAAMMAKMAAANAAKAAAGAAKKAAQASAKAAKGQAKKAANLSKRASAAAKKAAKSGTKSAKSAAKKGAKSAKSAAKKGAAAAKKIKPKTVAKAAVGAAAITVAYKTMKEGKKIEKCFNLCLPSNNDDYVAGKIEKSAVKYRSLQTDPSAPKDNPFCTDKDNTSKEACQKMCDKKCRDKHESGILDKLGPVGDAAKAVTGPVGDMAKGMTDQAFKALGLPPAFGPNGILEKFKSGLKYAAMVCCCLLLIYILSFFM